MKICTFNVNSIKTRKDLIIDWIKHRGDDLDVLCFQELKSVEEFYPSIDFENIGFHCLVSGQKAYNGVAICSKRPSKRILKEEIKQTWDEQKRVIAARIGDIDLINIYAPHGDERGAEKFNYKIDWYRKLISFLNDHFRSDRPLILTGDFNVAREDKDVWSPEELRDTIGTMPEEREAFEELLRWGLTDGYRHLFPEKNQYTWWNYIGGAIWRDMGMRIDYVLCTRPMMDKLTDMEVDLWPRKRRAPKPSDHAPLIAAFDNP